MKKIYDRVIYLNNYNIEKKERELAKLCTHKYCCSLHYDVNNLFLLNSQCVSLDPMANKQYVGISTLKVTISVQTRHKSRRGCA